MSVAEVRTIEERAAELADRIAAREGCDLVHCEWRRQGRSWVLRVTIDRRGGVSVEDCAAVSRQLSTALDVEDFIDSSYHLEVSSPGIDRPLFGPADYERFAGERVRVETSEPVRGRRKITGVLVGLQDGVVTVSEPEGQTWEIPLESVRTARLDPEGP